MAAIDLCLQEQVEEEVAAGFGGVMQPQVGADGSTCRQSFRVSPTSKVNQIFTLDSNLDRVQRKRNNQMRDAVNKAARFIVNQCLNDSVGNLILGWNEGQKDSSNLGKRNNQNFVVIPTHRLIERLKQLCSEYGIRLTITEEAYRSKASFLDGDSLPKYGEKPESWEASGERVKRGWYQTRDGHPIDADGNGSANIMKKVATQLGLTLVEVGRGILTPQRIDLFARLNRSYRKRCEVRLKRRAQQHQFRIPRVSNRGRCQLPDLFVTPCFTPTLFEVPKRLTADHLIDNLS